MVGFYIIRGPEVGHPSVEAWSVERPSFEPKGWKIEFRNAIREVLQKLPCVPGSGLTAYYISQVKEYCDVENILFYNIGPSYFSHLRCHSVCFERVFQPPPQDTVGNRWKHYFSYTLIGVEQEFRYCESPQLTLAKWDHLPCKMLPSLSKVSSIWHWFKLEMAAGKVQFLSRPSNISANLGLKMTIYVSKSEYINLISVIKPVFDGIMAAFSNHDGSNLNLVTERLSNILATDQKDLVHLLESESIALLGARRLIWPHGQGIQWNPNDELLVANKLSLVNDGAKRGWELSGEFFEIRKTI